MYGFTSQTKNTGYKRTAQVSTATLIPIANDEIGSELKKSYNSVEISKVDCYILAFKNVGSLGPIEGTGNR